MKRSTPSFPCVIIEQFVLLCGSKVKHFEIETCFDAQFKIGSFILFYRKIKQIRPVVERLFSYVHQFSNTNLICNPFSDTQLATMLLFAINSKSSFCVIRF